MIAPSIRAFSISILVALMMLAPVYGSQGDQDNRALFGNWFRKFYLSLYHAESLEEISPYFSRNFQRRWHNLTGSNAQAELKAMKQYYVGKPKLKSVTVRDGEAVVEIFGLARVDKRRGYATATYSMVKEDKGWTIETLSARIEPPRVSPLYSR